MADLRFSKKVCMTECKDLMGELGEVVVAVEAEERRGQAKLELCLILGAVGTC